MFYFCDMRNVIFKSAISSSDFEQIHRLNHRTFAEELGQYESNEGGELNDRFHGLNRYFIAKSGEVLIGMISLNCTPSFSIEKRLANPEAILAEYSYPGEVRMLAIVGNERYGIVLAGLFWQVFYEARRRGLSHLLISGLTDRAEMYRAVGFRDLGPAVPAGKASYIPMVMNIHDPSVVRKAERFSEWWKRRSIEPVSLMPGPVQIAASVRKAFEQIPVSHRAAEMVEAYNEVRSILSDLAGGMSVALMTGSGTLANDAIAACLRARFVDTPGIVLVNGEFGCRLQRQAKSAGLNFETLEWSWGEQWDFEAIDRRFEEGAAWVWCVHLETSTGQLNDLYCLSQMCEHRQIALAVDCVSSLGSVSIEHCRLWLASGVSGKALGAYAGLAIVFADDAAVHETPFERVSVTFNIAQNIALQEPMYTVASPQLFALRQALFENYLDAPSRIKRYGHYQALGTWIRESLQRCGITPLVDNETAAPTICTFSLNDKQCAERCRAAGFYIAHESSYLAERGWGQISVMGDLTQSSIEGIFDVL